MIKNNFITSIILLVLFFSKFSKLEEVIVDKQDEVTAQDEAQVNPESAQEDQQQSEFNPLQYAQVLQQNLESINEDQLSVETSSKMILQAYSQESLSSIEGIIEKESQPDGLDQDQQNLLYFYNLIKQFFREHLKKTELTKQELVQLVESNQIVDYLELILQDEHDQENKQFEQQQQGDQITENETPESQEVEDNIETVSS